MHTFRMLFAAGVLTLFATFPQLVCANENAALQYFLGILANGFAVPNYVDAATTDSPEFGFSTLLTPEQIAFLELDSTIAALSRFDNASECSNCDWGRFSGTCWTVDNRNPISGLHQLARTVMLRARQHYENGEWERGNRDVENVLRLARRMVTLCRPYEHQLFMVENIANGTAGAYLLRMPADSLKDLTIRLDRVGVFSPMKQLMADESTRLKRVAKLQRESDVNSAQLVAILSPYFANPDRRSRFNALSSNDQTAIVLELSDLLSLASNAMTADFCQAETDLATICQQSSSATEYFAIGNDYLNGELRENAQGVCRGTMFRAVVGRIHTGSDDFSTIDDPFADGFAELRISGNRKLLISELVHRSRIGFSFGDAGTR